MNAVDDRYHGLPDYPGNYLCTCQMRARKRTDPKPSWQKRVRSRGAAWRPDGLGSFTKLEEDLALLYGLARLDVNRPDDARGGRPEFILHFHGFQNHQPRPRADALTSFDLDPDDEAGHRGLEDSPSTPDPGGGGEPPNMPGSLIHHLDFDSIAAKSQGPVTSLTRFDRHRQ